MQPTDDPTHTSPRSPHGDRRPGEGARRPGTDPLQEGTDDYPGGGSRSGTDHPEQDEDAKQP
jgi:hypothetical protein